MSQMQTNVHDTRTHVEEKSTLTPVKGRSNLGFVIVRAIFNPWISILESPGKKVNYSPSKVRATVPC